jgi:hypothetical protein
MHFTLHFITKATTTKRVREPANAAKWSHFWQISGILALEKERDIHCCKAAPRLPWLGIFRLAITPECISV